MSPGQLVKIRDDLHLGDELRNPQQPNLYCHPRRQVNRDHRMIVISLSTSDENVDVLVLTNHGLLGWINVHKLENCV
jgi:hypothetical protein